VELELERMELDWMNHRVDRAALRGRLQQTEADLARLEPLFKAGLITDDSYAQLKISQSSLTDQLQEKNKLIARLEPIMVGIAKDAPKASDLSGESALSAAIKVQEAKLKLAEEQLAPVPLVSPIDGVVSVLMRRNGEAVVAGDTVLRISAVKPERLAGYLRQPLPFEPKKGMVAEIRTRGSEVKIAATTVTQVGSVMEIISPTMITAMHLPPTPAPETALRIEFALPPGLALRPGEHVDILMR
jgi:multidrug resistance efflux pump